MLYNAEMLLQLKIIFKNADLCYLSSQLTMEVEYLLTRAAERKPKTAVMTRRMETVERRRRAGASSGETRWRWSSVLEMVSSEDREDSQDWELNIIKPDQHQVGVTVMFYSKVIFPFLPTNPKIMLIVTIENLIRRVFGTSLSLIFCIWKLTRS